MKKYIDKKQLQRICIAPLLVAPVWGMMILITAVYKPECETYITLLPASNVASAERGLPVAQACAYDASNLAASPNGTTNHGWGTDWCFGTLNDNVGCTASPGDCWETCEDAHGGDLVAIDWWSNEGGACYCQNDCQCMMTNATTSATYGYCPFACPAANEYCPCVTCSDDEWASRYLSPSCHQAVVTYCANFSGDDVTPCLELDHSVAQRCYIITRSSVGALPEECGTGPTGNSTVYGTKQQFTSRRPWKPQPWVYLAVQLVLLTLLSCCIGGCCTAVLHGGGGDGDDKPSGWGWSGGGGCGGGCGGCGGGAPTAEDS